MEEVEEAKMTEQQILKQEMEDELKVEAYNEDALYNSLGVCMEYHMGTLLQDLENLSTHLANYGHEISVSDICDYIKDNT